MTRRFFQKKDLLVIGILLCAALLWLVCRTRKTPDSARAAQIQVNGEVVAVLPLDEDTVYQVPECPAVLLEVRAGSCAFIHSDCPDQVCVQAGSQSVPGASAACLPNRVVLRIIGEDGLDAVVG